MRSRTAPSDTLLVLLQTLPRCLRRVPFFRRAWAPRTEATAGSWPRHTRSTMYAVVQICVRDYLHYRMSLFVNLSLFLPIQIIIIPIIQNFGLVFRDLFAQLDINGTDTAVIMNLNNAFGLALGEFCAFGALCFWTGVVERFDSVATNPISNPQVYLMGRSYAGSVTARWPCAGRCSCSSAWCSRRSRAPSPSSSFRTGSLCVSGSLMMLMTMTMKCKLAGNDVVTRLTDAPRTAPQLPATT